MNAQLATPNQRVNLSVRSVTGLANGAGPRRPGPQVTRSVMRTLGATMSKYDLPMQ